MFNTDGDAVTNNELNGPTAQKVHAYAEGREAGRLAWEQQKPDEAPMPKHLAGEDGETLFHKWREGWKVGYAEARAGSEKP